MTNNVGHTKSHMYIEGIVMKGKPRLTPPTRFVPTIIVAHNELKISHYGYFPYPPFSLKKQKQKKKKEKEKNLGMA
jgi:hypothetical protein